MNETKKKRGKTFLSQGVAGDGIGFPREWEGGRGRQIAHAFFLFFFFNQLRLSSGMTCLPRGWLVRSYLLWYYTRSAPSASKLTSYHINLPYSLVFAKNTSASRYFAGVLTKFSAHGGILGKDEGVVIGAMKWLR